jgi:hypothetical protein
VKHLWVGLVICGLVLGSCGGSDDTGESGQSDIATDEVDESDKSEGASDSDGSSGIVTVGALGLDLPIPVPDDIPAPSDGVFVEVRTLGEWETIHIGTAQDAEQLRTAIKDHAGAVEFGRYDETLGALMFDLPDYAYSIRVFTTDQGDYDTYLEIATFKIEG